MPNTNLAFADPLLEETVPRNACHSRKFFIPFSIIVCLSFVMLQAPVPYTLGKSREHLSVQEPAINEASVAAATVGTNLHGVLRSWCSSLRLGGPLPPSATWLGAQMIAAWCLENAIHRPRQAITAAAKPILVLDVDECLVHSTDFTKGSDVFYRQTELSRPERVKKQEGLDSFQVQMQDGTTCTTIKRPGLDRFLKEVANKYDVFTFTAGTKEYAEPLLNKLDPEKRYLKGRLYRCECREVFVPGVGVQYLKDLTAITQELGNIVLVDNNPLSFVCQPRNGILIPDFLGEPDNELEKVLSLLQDLENTPDVRPKLGPMFNMESRLADLRAQFLGSSEEAKT